jgi:hypothetical protein
MSNPPRCSKLSVLVLLFATNHQENAQQIHHAGIGKAHTCIAHDLHKYFNDSMQDESDVVSGAMVDMPDIPIPWERINQYV